MRKRGKEEVNVGPYELVGKMDFPLDVGKLWAGNGVQERYVVYGVEVTMLFQWMCASMVVRHGQ